MTIDQTIQTQAANPSQARALADLARPSVNGGPVCVLWLGGPAGGKSTCGVDTVLKWIAKHAGINIAVCRKTHVSFETTTGLDFRKAVPRFTYKPKGQWQTWEFAGGRTLSWVGLDSFADYRGAAFGCVLIDQAETISEEQFDWTIERTRQQGMPLQVFVLANVPETESHWLYTRFDGSHPDYRVVRGGLRENASNLPEAYVAAMTQGRTDEYIRRMIDGQWSPPVDKPPVYPTYRDAMLLLSNASVMPGVLHEGIDGGPTDNYFAYVMWQRQHGRAIAIAEIVADHATGVLEFAELIGYARDELVQCEVDYLTVGDPPLWTTAKTDQRCPAEILAQAGIRMIRGESSKVARKAAMNDLLGRTVASGEPMLGVSPRCKTLHQAMRGGYCMKKDAETGAYTEPVKNAMSHVVEAFETSLARSKIHEETREKLEALRRRGGLRPKHIIGQGRMYKPLVREAPAGRRGR